MRVTAHTIFQECLLWVMLGSQGMSALLEGTTLLKTPSNPAVVFAVVLPFNLLNFIPI